MQNEQDPVRSLSDTLRAVSEEDAALTASEAVEARLRAEVRSIARARRQRLAVAAFATAALLVVAVAVPAWKRWQATGPGGRAAANPGEAVDRSTQAGAPAAEVATAFFPLTYSSMPLSNAQLVRLEVPRAALASFGLAPIDLPDSGSSGTVSGTVQADVLVGEDGVARAVRFVRAATAGAHGSTSSP